MTLRPEVDNSGELSFGGQHVPNSDVSVKPHWRGRPNRSQGRAPHGFARINIDLTRECDQRLLDLISVDARMATPVEAVAAGRWAVVHGHGTQLVQEPTKVAREASAVQVGVSARRIAGQPVPNRPRARVLPCRLTRCHRYGNRHGQVPGRQGQEPLFLGDCGDVALVVRQAQSEVVPEPESAIVVALHRHGPNRKVGPLRKLASHQAMHEVFGDIHTAQPVDMPEVRSNYLIMPARGADRGGLADATSASAMSVRPCLLTDRQPGRSW
jgi:hypothetical protein